MPARMPPDEKTVHDGRIEPSEKIARVSSAPTPGVFLRKNVILRALQTRIA